VAEREPKSPSIIGQYAAGASNPAGPRGLQQVSEQAHDVAAGAGPQSGSLIGQYAVEGGSQVEAARSWYTGANMEGVSNGWDTGFMAEAFNQFDEMQAQAKEQEDPELFADWFKRDDATGVVTWDDEERGYERGDVFNAGKKVGNVYKDFDERTANVMMAEFTLDRETKAKIFADPDRDRWLADEVGKVLDQNTEWAKNVGAVVEFEGNVDERQEGILEGKSEAGLVLAGGAGGTAVGAGIGSIVPGVGTLVGSGVGFLFGAGSAYLNRDQLSEQMARAQEITSLAGKKYGEMEAFSVGLKEWSGVGMKLISPTSNLVQGLADSDRGDGESGFYAVDENGQRTTSKAVRAADVGASLADAVLQFSNPLGVAAYMASTGGHVVGSAGFMASTGAGWNDRIGDFDDYEGGKEWAAAIGNVGIDVVQLGVAGAVVRAGAASRAAFGVSEPTVVGRAAAKAREKLMPWRDPSVRHETIQGMRFGIDDAGTAISRRPTLELLAPSEAIRYVSTAWRARSRVALGTKPGHDDFYRAALETAGGNRFSAAIVNGWAEGAEEGVQAVLEPVSFSADVDPWQVAESVLYGAASGMGMGLGAMAKQATTDQVLFSRANALHQLRNGEELTKDAWKQIDADQRKRLAIASPEEARELADAMSVLQRKQSLNKAQTSTISAIALDDLNQSLFARDDANANPNRDNVLVLAGLTGDRVVATDADGNVFLDSDVLPAHAGATSIYQALVNITNSQLAMATVAEDTERQIATLQAELARADGDRAAEIQAQLTELTDELELHERTAAIGNQLRRRLVEVYEQYRSGTDVAAREQAIDVFNQIIRNAFSGAEMFDEVGNPLVGRDLEAARRSVEILVARHPEISGDSFMFVMPQASKAMSRANAHGTMQVHQSTLLAPGADHDGDTEVSVNFARLGQAQIDALRQGSQYIARAGDNITDDVSITFDPPDGEKLFVRKVSEGLNAPAVRTEWSVAQDVVQGLISELFDRYKAHLPLDGLTQVLADFRTDLVDGNSDARANLTHALVRLSPAGFRAAAAANGNVPEMPWLQQRITLAWDRYLTSIAALSHDLEFTPKDVDADLTEDKAYLRANAQREAITDGQTAYLVTEGNNAVREGQKLHYSVFRAAVDMARGDMTTELFERFVRLYAELGSNMSQSELARVRGRNAIEKRVAYWLQDIADVAKAELGEDAPQALLLIANMQVADVRVDETGSASLYDGELSLLQLLLRKSVEIEKQQHRTALATDEEMQRKISRLERLSRRDPNVGESVTPLLAFKEVFGSFQVHDLLGDSAKYLGPHLTVNQLVADLANRTPESRSDQLYRWKRKAPYVMHEHVGDAPYSIEDARSGNLSSYKILVDAIAASVNTTPRRLREDNERTLTAFKTGINNLRSMLEEFRDLNGETLGSTADIDVLRAMLDTNPQVARLISDLIPDAAKLGAFAVVDGRPVAARWVEEMLVMPADKAAVTYVVNVRIAEWNVLGGNIDLDGEGTGREKGKSHEHPRSYHKIKSRMLQTFAHLAAQPDGIELDRLIMAMKSAPSVEALEEQLNNDPAWRGDRAELLAFVDDVAAYEADPRDVWSTNLPGTLQREAITAFADRTGVLSTAMAKFATQHATERTLLKAILAYDDDNTVDRDQASKYHKLLEMSIANRGWMSDHLGPAVRDRFTEKVQDGIIRMHDKGTADPAIAPFGEALVTTDEFGVKQSVFQSVDALTTLDVEDVLSNPTKLAEGPVRVGLPDGASLIVDFTTVRGAAIALADPALNAFAKQVLFPTARDVNAAGSLSTYLHVGDVGLKSMLEEANFGDLFNPRGRPLSVAQAHKYISMVEAAVRHTAITGSDEEQAKAYFPIQQIINEFVVAYTHRPGFERANRKQVRDSLVVDVATALQQVTALHGKDPRLAQEMVSIVKETLKARLIRDNSELVSKLATTAEKAVDDAAILDAYADVLRRQVEKLDTQIETALTNGDTAEVTRLQELQVQWMARLEDQLQRMAVIGSDDLVASAINMYTMSGDPAIDTDRKGAILRLLGSGNRVDKYQGPYHLIQRLNTVLANDAYALSDPDVFDTEEWTELGLWAATIYIAELSSRAGSGIKLSPLVLGEAGERIRRYYDASWSYLLDGFFNTQVLAAADRIASRAGWLPDFTAADVARTIETGLLNEKKLGHWTELVVPASMKAQQVLDSASVGLAIPVGGDLPKEAAAYVGAGRRTFALPGPEMLTTTALAVDADGDMARLDDSFFKLNNHFAASVVLRDAAGNEIDLLPQVGLSWLGEESVAASPYKIITLSRIDKAIADAFDSGQAVGPAQVEISYFDQDTQPFSRQWANNVYFEGVGREQDTGTTPGLVAELFFAPGAISKEAQQNPLNMATKGGAGYKATPIPGLDVAEQLEASHSVAGVLRGKAMHLWAKTYDVGQPLAGDANSLYKLMLQRHVVVGTNAAGEKEVWWAGKAIEWQTLNGGQPLSSPDFPLTGAALVSLSDSQAQTLLGEPGNKGLPGVVSRQTLNLSDLDIFPALTTEYLAERGLTRLGETATMRESGFAGRLPLMNVQWSGDKDSGQNTRYEAAIERYRGGQFQVFNRRRDTGFATAPINDQNIRALRDMLGVEGLATLFTKLGVPFAELRDLRELRLSEVLASKLDALTSVNPSSVVWQHLQGQSADPTRGVLSDTTIRETDGFSGKPEASWPTYEDIVVVDLDTFVDHTRGNYELAYDQAVDVLRTYTRTGATIVLAGSKGEQKLRADLASHLNEGSEGYTRMAESAHFFAPAQPDTMMHLSQLALDSSLTTSRVFSGDSLILTHNSDRYSSYGSSENATFWDLRPGQPVWRGESVTLLPTQIGTMFGRPVKGLGPNDQQTGVRTQLLELLRSPAGRAHLKRLGGDPVDVPVYRNENGVEEFGIRSLDAAMDRLQSLLEANKDPLTVGQELMIGDLIPTVAADGSIFLVRVGFQIPKGHKLKAQLAEPLDPNDPGKAPGRIAIATDELQQAWTTKPPATIESLDPDPLAGMSVRVKYDLSRYGKAVVEADGWKTVRSPMPNDLAGPDEDMSANGLRVNSFSSQKSPESKQAITGAVGDFGWAFALAGIDFRPDLVEFFLGAGRAADQLEADWDTVRTFLDRWASVDHGLTATQIARLLSEESFLAVVGPQISVLAEELGLSAPNLDDPFAKPTPNQRLGHVFLAALMADRVDVDQIARSSGLLTLDRLDSGAQVQLMPNIFTASLNDFGHPELREMLNDRINARMPRRPDGSRPYILAPNWDFLIEMKHPLTGQSEYVPGKLQISLEYPADENAVNYVQAGVRSSRQGASQHVAFVGYETLGMRTAVERASRVEQVLFEREGLADMDEDGGFWRMLRNVPTSSADPTFNPWRKRTRLQRLEIKESAAKMASYLKPIDTADWTEGELSAYRKVQDQILTKLFGDLAEDYRVEVDYLVRQLFGLPESREGQPEYVGKVSPAVALQAASIILDNVNDNMVPTYAGVVPVPHHSLMAAVFEANQGRPNGWAPRLGTGKKMLVAKNWREWVEASFGQVMEGKALFDSTFAQDMNGFMHTWQSASEDNGVTHVAVDQLREMKLLDPETNSFFASLDPREEARLTQPIIFETMRATLDAITGQSATFTRESAATTPDAELAKRIEKHVQWRATKKMPKQQPQSLKSFRDQGSWYLQSQRDTHNFFNNIANLSIGIRLLNPALWVSAIFEVYFRNKIETITNLATGTSTSVLGTAMSKAQEKVGLVPVYSVEQLREIDRLAHNMGNDDAFNAAIVDEMMYRNYIAAGRKTLGKKLEDCASWSARMTSDPHFGMTSKSMAKRYLESVFEYLRETDNVVPFDVMVRELNLDSLWLEKNFRTDVFNPHRAGMNRIAQVRSIKATTLSKSIMGVIDSLTINDKFAFNAAGNLLKIPLLFTRFNANALIAMTGLGGIDQMLAMSLDQRESSALGRMKSLMSGKPYVQNMDRLDMTDVLEGANLFRPFVRGAVTQTGLLAFGMLAGGLGLSGEDEETKRRRRLATYLGTPYYYDPRRVENDFRYADAQFLDWMPDGLESLLKVGDEIGPDGERKVAQPHWIFRQFMSPVAGIERFLNTGDVRQIGWGFSDAFSVMPNSISRVWNEAQMTAELLTQSAREVDGKAVNDAEGQALEQKFIITVAGVYEKALLENSFVNAIRNGFDDYDRNPWEQPDVNKRGEIIRDPKTGAPIPSTALEQTIDPRTGEPVVSYVERGAVDAYLHQYAENNLGAAVLLSLFTGQPDLDSSYFRQNMVPAQKSITLPEKGQAYDEAVIMAALHGKITAAGGPDASFANLSQYEAEQMVWAMKPEDAFWSGEDVTARAKVLVAQNNGPGKVGGMTLLDADGREILSKDGARGVLTSLAKGMIELDHPSLAGVHISVPMRQQIQEEWTDELVREGLGMGLTERVAKIRARRIWYGNTYEDPNATGLRDLLWTDEIPWTGKVTYNQLNTTFVMGPDGRPWATPFERQNLLQALGIPLPTTPIRPPGGGLTRDSRGNVVDNVHGINTGLMALERVEDQGQLKPPEDEPKAFTEAAKYAEGTDGGGSGWKDFGYTPYKKRGYTPYKRRSYSSGGGSTGYPNFTRMYGLPNGQTPYGNDIPFINTSNPILRRADVRRERVWSERGRLNQWQ